MYNRLLRDRYWDTQNPVGRPCDNCMATSEEGDCSNPVLDQGIGCGLCRDLNLNCAVACQGSANPNIPLARRPNIERNFTRNCADCYTSNTPCSWSDTNWQNLPLVENLNWACAQCVAANRPCFPQDQDFSFPRPVDGFSAPRVPKPVLPAPAFPARPSPSTSGSFPIRSRGSRPDRPGPYLGRPLLPGPAPIRPPDSLGRGPAAGGNIPPAWNEVTAADVPEQDNLPAFNPTVPRNRNDALFVGLSPDEPFPCACVGCEALGLQNQCDADPERGFACSRWNDHERRLYGTSATCACGTKMLTRSLCNPHRYRHMWRLRVQLKKMATWRLRKYGSQICPACLDRPGVNTHNFQGPDGGEGLADLVYGCLMCHEYVVGENTG